MLNHADRSGLQFFVTDWTDRGWRSLNYAPGFEFGKWLDSIPSINHKLLVKSVLSNVECRSFIPEHGDIKNLLDGIIYFLSNDRNISVDGLGVAFLASGRGISFPSHFRWQTDVVKITKYWHENGVDNEIDLDVSNIFLLNEIEKYILEIKKETQSNREYFNSISIRDNPHFPNLIFCESALEDLRSSLVTANDFPRVIDALNKLNSGISGSSCQNDLIINTGLDISGESAETMRTPKHARKRIFDHPDAGRIIFESHVKNFPDFKRMHIYPDYANSNICIGYFGKHLSTVNEPK
jgi:hypothetical protein